MPIYVIAKREYRDKNIALFYPNRGKVLQNDTPVLGISV